MRELIDAMEDNWSKWRTTEGIKNLPEISGPARTDSGSKRQRLADPLHRRRVGAEQELLPARRVGSATFLSAIRRWKPMIASGSPVSSSANASARALDVARELVGDRR